MGNYDYENMPKFKTKTSFEEFSKHPFYIQWRKNNPNSCFGLFQEKAVVPDRYLENGEYYCKHEFFNIVRVIYRSGTGCCYKYQCEVCGAISKFMLKKILVNEEEVVEENNPDFYVYHGGVKWDSYEEFLDSERWQKLRTMVLEYHGYKCKDCRIDIDIADAQIHHLHYRRSWGVENPKTDLIPLCRDCHWKSHFWDYGADEETWIEEYDRINNISRTYFDDRVLITMPKLKYTFLEMIGLEKFS